jgi:LPXTG-site transpeptidase (sortase) family protein
MRLALRLGGTMLIVASVLGLAVLGVLLLNPEPAATPFPALSLQASNTVQQRAAAPDQRAPGEANARALGPNVALDAPAPGANPLRSIGQPITHVEIAAISLSADVVPAGLIQRDGGVTWEVPAFKIGHAESTAGAGQPGNAVLLGHVTSVRSGNVFANLDQVEVGQPINVFAETTAFTYTVVSTTHVPRTDTTSIEPGEAAAVSLITCTGVWLPTIWDYTERLVVRAELNHDQPVDQVARY